MWIFLLGNEVCQYVLILYNVMADVTYLHVFEVTITDIKSSNNNTGWQTLIDDNSKPIYHKRYLFSPL